MNKSEIRNQIFALVEAYFSADMQQETFIPGQSRIGVGYPVFDHKEINNAIGSLLDVWLSMGPKVRQFEADYAEYIGTDYGIAVNSGSSANLLAINALLQAGYVKPGAEVIVPAATFTTVISPLLQNGLKPVFVDIDGDTHNISVDAIAEAINDNTGLIMPVHSLGLAADMPAINRLAEKHGLPVLEDCCEAHAAAIEGQRVGSFGLISTYSFFVAHNMTTGEGGMVMTSDSRLEKILRSTREFGRLTEYDSSQDRFYYSDGFLNEYDERYVFEKVGYNVRMTDICAALGIEQLKKLDALTQDRINNAEFYTEQLKEFSSFLQLPYVPESYLHSFYGYPIIVRDDAPFKRQELVRFLESRNIETRAFMGGNLALQPAYRDDPAIRIAGDLKHTELMTRSGFFIGCHSMIKAEQRDYIIDAFRSFVSSVA